MGNKCTAGQSTDLWRQKDELLRFEVNSLRRRVEDLEKTLNVTPSIFEKHPSKMSSKQLQEEFERLEGLVVKLEDIDTTQAEIPLVRSSLKKYPGISAPASTINDVVDMPQEECHPAAGDLNQAELAAVNDPSQLIGQESVYGLKWDYRWAQQPAGPRDEHHRRKVRDGTMMKVIKELKLDYFGERATKVRLPPQLCPELFVDETQAAREAGAAASSTNLLGRYDVVCAKVRADFDRNWDFIKGDRRDFWVAHAAAVNIGETADSPDFGDFCLQPGCLDEERYYAAMGRTMSNVVAACDTLGVEHLVFFPFGMGAFIRHISGTDTSFTDDAQMQRLRRRVGQTMVKALERSCTNINVHLCLQFAGKPPPEEAIRNADALLRAFLYSDRTFRHRVTVYPEGDCLHLSHELAKTSQHVLLLNGANRRLLGNHWFADHARRAIDENLHRRSWRMAYVSYILNKFNTDMHTDIPIHREDELRRTVERLGGRVHILKK